jgi:serine protease Do
MAGVGLGGMAVVLAAGALVFSILNYVGGNGSDVTSGAGNYWDGNAAQFEEGTIAEVAGKVAPSVVSILTETQGRYSSSSGAGTGMIVSADGYVLTNKHVVDGASSLTVVMDSGESYDASVVGTDPINDVAFVKMVGVEGLPVVTLGDSTTIKVGQPVVAIGNALGQYQNTITQGIVSGTGRSVTASGGGVTETLTDMIQTDASINLGNSGGPLVNAAGEVIGINTAVSTEAQGIGFAIPISSVKGMLAGLVKTGEVERAYLGVRYLTVTADVAKEYGLSVKRGAYVFSDGSGDAVVKGGPADKAGVRSGDIVLEVGGVEVGVRGSLSSLVAEHAVGESLELVVLRGDEEILVKVVLEAYPEE